MHRRLASEWRPRDLATAVGDYFVYVHVELGSAACHPHVQRKHLMMLAGENLVANLGDQFVLLVVQPLAGMIGFGCSFLQNRIGCNHFAGNQILPNVEMFERTLGLCTPKFVRRYLNYSETVAFLPHV